MSSSRAAHHDLWRLSVATYNRVVFAHPQNDILMLALERRATVRRDGKEELHVWSQPFGGAVHILDPLPLQEIVGKIQFDSERSRREGDFRILIPPARWESLKQYCLDHLQNPDDPDLESHPHRELTEEFAGSMQIDLKPHQYAVQPAGFVLEDNPLATDNIHARGWLTVRLYRIFEVRILDAVLCKTMLAASRSYSDRDLAPLAVRDLQKGGQGHANAILTLPLDLVSRSWRALPPESRFRKIVVDGHELDESVLAILEDVEVPQYQRVSL